MLETLQIFSAKHFTKKDSNHLMVNLINGEGCSSHVGAKTEPRPEEGLTNMRL